MFAADMAFYYVRHSNSVSMLLLDKRQITAMTVIHHLSLRPVPLPFGSLSLLLFFAHALRQPISHHLRNQCHSKPITLSLSSPAGVGIIILIRIPLVGRALASLADIVDHVDPVTAAEGSRGLTLAPEAVLGVVWHQVWVRDDGDAVRHLLVMHRLQVRPQQHLAQSELLIAWQHAQRVDAHGSSVFFVA